MKIKNYVEHKNRVKSLEEEIRFTIDRIETVAPEKKGRYIVKLNNQNKIYKKLTGKYWRR